MRADPLFSTTVHGSGSTKVIAVHGWMAAGDLFEPLIDVNTGRIRERAWLERLRDLSVAGTDPRALEGYLASWSGPGFAGELVGTEVPTSVVIGRLDPGTPEDRVRETYLSLLANVRFDVLDEVGHYAMQEAPVALAHAMTRHFEHVSADAFAI